MAMGAGLAGLGVYVVVFEGFEVDVLIGSECLQHGIETLPRPLEQLATPRDGATVVVTDAGVGGLKLLPERVGLEESRALLLMVEPCAQGLSYGGVARGLKASRGALQSRERSRRWRRASGRRTLTTRESSGSFLGRDSPHFPQNTTECRP
jgi:hypothetical protein